MKHRTSFACVCILLGFVYGALRAQDFAPPPPLPEDFLLRLTIERVASSIRHRNPSLAEYLIQPDGVVQAMADPSGEIRAHSDKTYLQIGSVKLRGNYATVLCSLPLGKNGEQVIDTVECRREGPRWKVFRSKFLLPLWETSKSIPSAPTSLTKVNFATANTSLTGLSFSDRMLLQLPAAIAGGDSIMRITQSVISNRMNGVDLFRDPVDIEGFQIPGTSSEIGFVLDQGNERIVFGNEQTGQLRSYGDSAHHNHLILPAAMAVSSEYEIFVVESWNSKVKKLIYIPAMGVIQFHSEIQLPVIPTDIVYDNADANTLTDDRIWVSSDYDRAIVQFDRNFNVVQRIESFRDGSGGVYPISFARKLMINRYTSIFGDVAYISGYDSFVIINTAGGGQQASLVSFTTFPQPCLLRSIGLEWPLDYLVADAGRPGGLHKFSFEGDYIATIGNGPDGRRLFGTPTFVSSSGVLAKEGSQLLNILTCGYWYDYGGVENCFPNADAMNLSAVRNGNNIEFRWRNTNFCMDSVQVLSLDGSYQQTLLYDTLWTGDHFMTRSVGSMPFGTLRFRVKVLPRYYSSVGSYREITFENYPSLSAPLNLTTTSQPGNVMLNWSGVTDAQGYKVYRDNILVGANTTTTYWDNVPATGQDYAYVVKATYSFYEGPASSTVTARASHLVSDNLNATLSSSQRHLVFGAPAGSASLPLYGAYQHNGKIFLTYSTNLGTSWSSEKYLGEGSSISLVPGVIGSSLIGMVWENQIGNISFATWDPLGNSFARYFPLASSVTVPANPSVSLFEGYICAVWAEQDGLKYRLGWRNAPNWSGALPIPSSVEGDRNPSLSLCNAGSGHLLYLTTSNDYAVYLRRLNASGTAIQWTVPFLVRGSDDTEPVVSQVQGEFVPASATSRAHVVWQSPNSISYQRFTQTNTTTGVWMTTTYTMEGSAFKNPSISVFANGDLSIMWSDDRYIYRRDRVDGAWASVSASDYGTNVTIAGGFERPVLASQSRMYVGGSPPLYNIKFTPGPPKPIAIEVAKDGLLEWGDETEDEVLELKLEEPVYTNEIPFTPVNDTASYSTLEDAMRAFESQEFVVGPGSDPFSNDSIAFSASIWLRDRGRNRATSEDRLDSKQMSEEDEGDSPSQNLRLIYEALDAVTREVVRTLAEIKFKKDGRVKAKRKGTLAGLQGRRIIISPRLDGLPNQLPNFSASLSHVLKISVNSSNSSATTLLSRSSSTPIHSLPLEFALHASYPNPFNPFTTITFDLPDPSHVSLVIYDVLGRKVAELENVTKEAGYHSATWNAPSAASGMYFARFTATDQNGNVKLRKVSKLLLTK